MSAVKHLIALVKNSEAMAEKEISTAVGHALAEMSGLQVGPHDLPTIETGQSVELRMQAKGGVPPYKFSVADTAQLPPGLTMSEDGLISGSARQPAGPFIVTVTDAEGGISSVVPSLTVVGQVIPDPTAAPPTAEEPPLEPEPVAMPVPAPAEPLEPEATPLAAEAVPVEEEPAPAVSEDTPATVPEETPVEPQAEPVQ